MRGHTIPGAILGQSGWPDNAMMEYLDIGLIINTAIGTTIGTIIATILALPVVLQLLKQSLTWPGWKRMGAALSPFFVIVGLLLLAGFLSAHGEKLRIGWQPLYRSSCQNECAEAAEGAARSCAELSVLYANPKRRGEIVPRDDLRKILPENAPPPHVWGHRERRFDGELAKNMFEACMERQGYTTHSCVEQEPCYRVYIDEGLRPRLGSLDYRNVDLVEIVDPVVAVP